MPGAHRPHYDPLSESGLGAAGLAPTGRMDATGRNGAPRRNARTLGHRAIRACTSRLPAAEQTAGSGGCRATSGDGVTVAG
jgi:hypothetical protein